MIPYQVDESAFVTHYKLPHERFSKVPTFKWYDAPVLGVGKASTPIVSLDEFMNGNCVVHKDMIDDVYKELQQNKHLLEPYVKGLVVNGVVPRELNGGVQSIDALLLNRLSGGWHEEWHRERIKHYDNLSQVKSHFYRQYDLEEFWRGVCHMRKYTTFANKSAPSEWLPYADKFPKLIKFVESLPFKHIGYALFFISKPNTPVYLHRDTFVRNHHVSNFINIMFDRKSKPTFVYDSIHKKRHYLQPYSSFYTFNEADLHGVDPEPEERWMLRVEGIFQPWLAEELGMVNNEVFNWSYSSAQAFLRESPNGIRVHEETNI